MSNLLTQEQITAIKLRVQQRYTRCIDPSDTALEDIRRLIEHVEASSGLRGDGLIIVDPAEQAAMMREYKAHVQACLVSGDIPDTWDAFVRRTRQGEV